MPILFKLVVIVMHIKIWRSSFIDERVDNACEESIEEKSNTLFRIGIED